MKKALQITALVFLLLVLIGLGWAMTNPANWQARHETPKESAITFRSGMPFSTYMETTFDLIERVTNGKVPAIRVVDVANRAPREYRPSPACPAGQPRRSALLVHGLFDSPYSFSSIGQRLAENCILARSILLPGHGTVPGHLNSITLQDWQSAVRYGIESLAADTDDPIILIGYSTGAALIADYLLNQPPVRGAEVEAFIGFAPGIMGPINISPAMREFLSIAWTFPRFQYAALGPGDNPVKYDSFPWNAYRAFADLQDRIGPVSEGSAIDVPTFFTMGARDETVAATPVQTFFCNRLSNRRRFLLFDGSEESLPCADIETMAGSAPDFSVREQSHVSLIYPPDDAIFGINGRFQDCLHYQNTEFYVPCKDNTFIEDGGFYAETSDENIDTGLLRRTSFNPHFDTMMKAIIDFLNSAS